MKKIMLIPAFVLLVTFYHNSYGQQFELNSPDGKISLEVNVDDEIIWTVSLDDEILVEEAVISLATEDGVFGEDSELNSDTKESHTGTVISAVPQKNRNIEDNYEELTLEFEDFSLQFRAYDNGISYRFIGHRNGEIEIEGEQLDIKFPEGTSTVFPQEESLYSHYERDYLKKELTDIKQGEFASLPCLFSLESGEKILFTDADLFDYPNAFVMGTGSNEINILHPKVVKKAIPNPFQSDRSQVIEEEEDYIALTAGNRNFPWRVFMLSGEDKDLLDNEMVYLLSRKQMDKNVDWIKPGRVAWDWYNANNVWGVDFESGINNETYKYYIDFASKYGLEYIILDEGWTKSTTEILESNPDIDVPELVEYGEEKGVGIILWVLWKPLSENMDEILDLYADWGTKGVKVDFMQRADQEMVNSYTEIANECFKREMLVDFHGAYKPSGLRRMFPNVISYEGVKGSEHNKWSQNITPEHNTTIPFIRMAVGPMDYTPGAMSNAHIRNHQINFLRPISIGTRAHQVAMYVVFESALQMLCDTPSSYMKDEVTASFISVIPTVWDESIPLDSRISEYVSIARRSGNQYYIGVLNNEKEREVELDLSFLPKGNYEAIVFTDGVNSDKYAEDYRVEKMEINSGDELLVTLAGGGGWTAIVQRK